jgi:hypothetical protein
MMVLYFVDNLASNGTVTFSAELERMWKEAVISCYSTVS